MKRNRTGNSSWKAKAFGTAMGLGCLLLAVSVSAQEPAERLNAPRLAASQAEEFLGEWVLTVESDQGEQALSFSVMEVEGFARATIEMPGLGTTTVDDIAKTAEGLALRYDVTFGEQLFDMVMDVARTDEGLMGKMADESGLFSLAFTGLDKAAAEAAGVAGRRAGDNETVKLTIDDAEVVLRFDMISVDDDAFAGVREPVEGEVIAFATGRPSKFWTPIDLTFGSQLVKAHNHGPDYPGVYSLWLRHENGQWFLVFNENPDVWGTQHDARADVAEVPLEMSRQSDSAEVLTVSLEGAGEGGLIRIRWGDAQWTATFGPAS